MPSNLDRVRITLRFSHAKSKIMFLFNQSVKILSSIDHIERNVIWRTLIYLIRWKTTVGYTICEIWFDRCAYFFLHRIVSLNLLKRFFVVVDNTASITFFFLLLMPVVLLWSLCLLDLAITYRNRVDRLTFVVKWLFYFSSYAQVKTFSKWARQMFAIHEYHRFAGRETTRLP